MNTDNPEHTFGMKSLQECTLGKYGRYFPK